MSVGQMTTSRAFRALSLVAVAGVSILMSGCGGASEAEVAQAQQVAVQAQAQKDTIKQQRDTQATLSADVKRLKDEAAAAAAAKVAAADAATNAAAAEAAATKTAKAKAVVAASKVTWCTPTVGAGDKTSCTFAKAVATQFQYGEHVFWEYSAVMHQVYKMTCTPAVTTICRGGNGAVVYIR